jgi:lysylphosphatidylglycerol synthetase-like protein (DUF2156 family)
MSKNSLLTNIGQYLKFIQYNFKIVFGNKFGYFLFAAIVFFGIVTGIVLYNDASIEEYNMYYLLIFPALLLIFYPTVFGLQNDRDSRMLETLFGIPNYRYKIYLTRLVLILVMVFIILYGLSWLTDLMIIQISNWEMTWQLMFPVLFMGSLAFLLSTQVKHGNAAAVIMIIIGLFFWILAEPLEESKWNIFLNPFRSPRSVSQTVWMNIILMNRIYLIIGSVIAVLWGLTNLQNREKLNK